MTTTPAPTDIDTLKADIKQAHDEICNIAEGKRRWTMSIPAKEATDSDLVISRALAGAERALDELAIALPFLRDGALAEHHSKCGESSQWDIRRCEDADCLERAHLLEAHGLIPQEWDTYPIPEANPATTAEPADEPLPTITESEAERLANLRDCLDTSRGGLHCTHYQEGDGNCHDCGRPNYCPDGGVVPDAEPADEPKADHDECDGTDHPGMTCDQYDTALEPTPPGQLVLAPLTDEPAAG